MGESEACLNARASLEDIRSLKRDFEVAYDLVASSGKQDDVEKAQGLKRTLEAKTKALQETLAIVEAEHLFDLKHQYEEQMAFLKKTGLVETRKETDASGAEREVSFMTGIDRKAYPLPSYDTLVLRLAERKELLETKADQGFVKLLLVPFGMSLDQMMLRFRAYLLEYKQGHAAFGRTSPAVADASDEPGWNPLYVWEDGYKSADTNGTLIYDPISFDASHTGATKAEVLARQETEKDTAQGWRVLLLQGGENGKEFKGIPRGGQGKTEGTKTPRKDIETGTGENPITPRDYLMGQLQGSGDPGSPYHGESGMTPEEWIVAFMAELEETGKPMDNYQNGTDSIAYLTGAYFTASGNVPNGYWYRDDRQASVSGSDPDRVVERIGVRSAVRV